MLVTMDWSPLEGAVQCVRDIPTVGEEVNSTAGGLNCLKDCCDLPSLGGLPGSQNGPVGPVSIEEDEPPSCTGPAASGAASPVGCDQCDPVAVERLWLPVDVTLHLDTARPRVVVVGNIARVAKGAWGIR